MLERRTGQPEGTPPTKLASQAVDDKESRVPGFHPLIVGAECPAARQRAPGWLGSSAWFAGIPLPPIPSLSEEGGWLKLEQA